MPSAVDKVHAVVLGAGVVGLAVARALSQHTSDVLILDRASAIGTETSSRNSEVIHAGLYYPPDSLKASLCVRGNQAMYEYCRNRGIAYNRCGKLIVAKDVQQNVTLQRLQEQGQKNGVETRMLTNADIAYHEPALAKSTLHSALWSPSTGIVDSHAFMLGLLADAEENSATLVLNAPVTDARINVADNSISIYVDGVWISCDILVNCGGLWATHIAHLFHNNDNRPNARQWEPPRQYYAKGTYFRLQQESSTNMFRSLIYPVPDPNGGLGVHATMDLQGQVRFGPDVEWCDVNTHPDAIHLTPDANRAMSFYESVRSYWPALQDGALVPDYCGVRPKLHHVSSSSSFHDFQIVGPSMPGLVHLFGIESPGLTSSLSIAEYAVNLLKKSGQLRR